VKPVRVARVISRLNVGGPAQHVVTLAEGLAARGFATRLVAGRPGPDEGDMSDLARAAGVDLVEVAPLGRAPGLFRDLRALWALFRLFRRHRPAIVHTHTSKAGALGRLAAALAGVPVRVHTFHGHVLEAYFSPFWSEAARAAERFLAAASSAIVALSPRQRRDLVARFRVAPRGRVHVVPPGIDLAPFADARVRYSGELRRELGIPPAAPLLGTVGRLVPVKAIDHLLGAMETIVAERADAWLVVAGGGPERARLEARARAAGLALRVRFLGERRDLPRIYADLDLFALASRNEGTPLALIEALAAGVPAVATAVGGVPDVLGGGPDAPGLLVPSGDARALAAAALALIRDPAERARRAALGPARAARFSRERLLDETAALYARLLAR
jgi:glycosyltransferase involved in cell wall biosynthesis